MARQFPYMIEDVDPETNEQLLIDFKGERTGFLQVGPQKWLLPNKYRSLAALYYNFTVRPDDVWIVTFPRSGTTILQEMTWLIGNNLDYKAASKTNLFFRVPVLGYFEILHDEVNKEIKGKNAYSPEKLAVIEEIHNHSLDILNNMTARRFIKTHLPISLLPPDLLTTGCKVIYSARNPKDVAVSYYHLSRLLTGINYTSDFTNFWEYFQNGLVEFSPIWNHINEGWNLRNNPSFLFLFYEDMVKDMAGTIMRVAEFLGKDMTEDQVAVMANHLHINNFKRNESVTLPVKQYSGLVNEGEQDFIRKGKTGSWVEEFSPEILKMADKWIEENLKKTDLRFPE